MSDEFDFIIVGAGSAGCVLANQLSRDPNTRVLLVEKGPVDNNPLISMPRGIGKLLSPGNPFLSTYQVTTGEGNGPGVWVKGRTLGGSSSVNGMVYVRGHPEDFQSWKAMGCKGWGWSDVLPCFIALEDHQLGASSVRGTGGPLKITVPSAATKLSEAIINAAVEAGIPRVIDVNDAPGGGIGYQPTNIWRGERQSASVAFLRPILRRPNLRVLTDTSVLRVLFSGAKTSGVILHEGQGEKRATARREVILCAGAVESPKLLQLSGIGDGALLSSLGLQVVADAPSVGRNLQEHFFYQAKFRVRSGSLNREYQGVRLLSNVFRYWMFRNGPMTHPAYELCAFVKTRPELTRPDAELGIGLYSMQMTARGLVFDDNPGFTFGAYVMNPKSRGELKITSPDPNVPPFINANYLAELEDRTATVAMIRCIRNIVSQEALSQWVVGEEAPGSAAQSDEEILKAYRSQASAGFHVSGSCRMGADPDSVVDPELRVRGVDGLRVVDTSVFPTLVSGNTNAAAMATALRAAQIILNEHK